MTPGDGFVVRGPGAEAAVEVVDEAVRQGAEGLVVQVADLYPGESKTDQPRSR